ncbi:MAG: hypothetical protein L3J10_02905 [Sulfurimonas sp.]|nr:hypothetical protein [Sulfurimonas sp.]
MKTFFIVLIFLISFAGCSSKNAFDKFKLTKEQELSISSLQNSKITSKTGEVDGVFSAIYLNEIYPESFNTDEYFFVYTFIKDSKEMNNPKDKVETDLTLKLNSKPPIKLKKLPQNNRFSKLVSIKSAWNKYYLVAFKADENLSLVLENGQSSSASLVYQKDE